MLEYTSRKMAVQKITDEFIKVASEKAKRLADLIKRKNSRKTILESFIYEKQLQKFKKRRKSK
mgnify:CR=1 FL=1